jgi:hypothetical protein
MLGLDGIILLHQGCFLSVFGFAHGEKKGIVLTFEMGMKPENSRLGQEIKKDEEIKHGGT